MKRLDHRTGNGDFINGILGQRNTHSITDTISQKRTHTDRALDAAVLAIARFGHTQVNRIIPVCTLLLQASNKQTIGLDHHFRIRCFHRENKLMIIHFTRDAGKFKRALDHAKRSVAIAIHDTIGKRTMVGADAHRTIFFDA